MANDFFPDASRTDVRSYPDITSKRPIWHGDEACANNSCEFGDTLTEGPGRISAETLQRIGDRVRRLESICSGCTVADKCLDDAQQLGMRVISYLSDGKPARISIVLGFQNSDMEKVAGNPFTSLVTGIPRAVGVDIEEHGFTTDEKGFLVARGDD